MTDKLTDDVVTSIEERIPLRKFGTPKDVADLVVFLATNEGNYITGQVLQVDGGMVI